MKLRHRLLRGALAAPFVLTAPLASGDSPPKEPKPRPKMVQAFENGDRVWLNREGSCELRAEPKCPPNVPCNPPQPRAVECPEPGLVKRFDNGDRIHRDESLTCIRTYVMDCPEGVKCNPPPPRAVACPEEPVPKEGYRFIDRDDNKKKKTREGAKKAK